MVLQDADTVPQPFGEDGDYINPHPNMSHISVPLGNQGVAVSSRRRHAAPISANGSDIRTSGGEAVPSATGLMFLPVCLCHRTH